MVMMAHLKAREVRDGAERKQWKLRLMRGLYERGYNREEILTLFRFIDWPWCCQPPWSRSSGTSFASLRRTNTCHVAVIVLVHTQCYFCCQRLIVQTPGCGKGVGNQLGVFL